MENRQAEALKRFQEGRDKWNEWAKHLLESRQNTDEWRNTAIVDFTGHKFPKEGVDFSGYIFPAEALFDGAVFQGEASFKEANFKGKASFLNSTFYGIASFDRAEFNEEAWFSRPASIKWRDESLSGAKFQEMAYFNSVVFKGMTYFNDVLFETEGWFRFAIFELDVQFLKAKFTCWARLDDIQFRGNAQFTKAQFLDHPGNSKNGAPGEKGVWFVGTLFKGQAWFNEIEFENDITFQGATFEDDVIFKNTKFLGRVGFDAIHVDRIFTLAGSAFNKVPNFIQAHFVEAPRFDDVRIRQAISVPSPSEKKLHQLASWPTRFWRGLIDIDEMRIRQAESIPSFPELTPSPPEAIPIPSKLHRWKELQKVRENRSNDQAKWRALRRLAIQGHDHEREHDFFASELWSTSMSSARFWFGVIYWAFSRHGRSIYRPLFCWLVMTVLCGYFYLAQTPHKVNVLSAWLHDKPCVEAVCIKGSLGELDYRSTNMTGITTAAREATNLALRNSLFDLENGTDAERLSFGCLYGFHTNITSNRGDKFTPVKPRIVSLVMAFQKIFATIFLFLFGLALRNMFRVK